MNIKIKEGTIEEVLSIAKNIPELNEVTVKDISMRIYNKDFHILIANLNTRPAGFMIGYDRDSDGSYYIWLGGVRPEYRNKTLGSLLLRRQYNRARDRSYTSVRLKTREKFKAMKEVALKEGYSIITTEEKTSSEENRIWMEKKIREN